jgi:hypothetical protein
LFLKTFIPTALMLLTVLPVANSVKDRERGQRARRLQHKCARSRDSSQREGAGGSSRQRVMRQEPQGNRE